MHHETRALVEQLADITRKRLEYGESTQSELLRIETELDTLDAKLVELQANQEQLSASLIPLLGRRPNPSELVLPVPHRMPMTDILNGTDHPMIQAAKARTAEARARLEAAEVGRRPVFTANAGYNSLWADERKRWMVGVGVQIPLSGQRQNSAVRKAAAEVSRRQWQTTQAHRDLLASISDVKAAIQAGYGRLEILDERHLPNQRAHWEATLNELASGTGRLEDAIDSARQLTGVKLTREAVIRDLFSASARYQALRPKQTSDVPSLNRLGLGQKDS
ncbi:MAG: TolC family protein [Pseudomonadota bacterium]|jgi:outer membrane protein TolC|uniref:TolC family protein n=1 Tax=Marinobacter sp. TaxID=50741 RepID=UPI002E889748|nr:TolC family protein [Pseudomonadota bacterium]